MTPSDPPKGAPGGGLGGPRGGYHQISCDMSILGFSIVGKPKMTFIFILKDLQPLQGRPQRGGGLAGGLQGMLSSILPNIMCYVNSGVLNSGKSKNDLHFHFRLPQPYKGALAGVGVS